MTSAFEELFPLAGRRFSIELAAPGLARVVAAGEPVGEVKFEPDDGTLTIRSLCIAPEHRSFGAGSEAAQLLVRAAETAADVRILRAWAPPHAGLSVYFWSRMGLRPLHGEGPEGGLWFERIVG